ncbi:hypothetical protein [Bosea sp. (in: a-proteobacteria)]|uniref:hypothetical protein n=1 Tax=Bosea sp. (in: a-proteobacteria) TaxID=1871050 RepID=UPI002632C142|nr:hypothetical protein [Bosea sp. (in: a-proteobacteria)]MCO5092636.1 hypothetical protein [Bosea sp. (in: a-proteobacteria)]
MATTYRAYSATRGWIDKQDAIAIMARAFAEKLQEVTCVRALGEPDDEDAAKVNAFIRMIAEGADQLVTAIIENAEGRDLVQAGAWMDIPLVEVREFEVAPPVRHLQAAE